MQYDSNALLPGVGAQSENRSPAAEPYQKKNKNPALRAEKPNFCKAAIKRVHNDACISYAEWEQVRAQLNAQLF